IAPEQGLEHQHQRIFAALDMLLKRVGSNSCHLRERKAHLRSYPPTAGTRLRNGAGRLNSIFSATPPSCVTGTGRMAAIAASTLSTKLSGAEAPAVMPIVRAASTQDGLISPPSSIR